MARTAFIGGGNMAEAIIRGLLSGGVAANDIIVSEPVAQRRDDLAKRYAVTVAAGNVAAASAAEVVILAVKPQTAAKVLSELADVSAGRLFVSILAGVTTSAIEAALQGAHVVRVMPNTPALVLEGAAAVAGGSFATEEEVARVVEMFALVGRAYIVPEKLLDGVTGLSGSGPAYVLAFIEALSDAGVKVGLPRETALGLAAQTVFGTAKLLLETGEHPALLREKVTSPGGTTIAGLHALEQRGFRGAVIDAVEAATVRSAELGKG